MISVQAPFARHGLYPVPGSAVREPDVDPDEIYTIWLPPRLLYDAAPTFRAVPITDDAHQSTDWIDFDPSIVIGCTGPEVAYRQGRLWTLVKFWHPQAIASIKDGTRRHLSIGFRAAYEMKPGDLHGQPYDGTMIDLVGDHVALVEQGEAGDACSLPPYQPVTKSRRMA
jgi:hypothetical protein